MILIIGYGNPLRGDDGLGWHAAEALRERLAGRDVKVITSHQLTPEMAEPISRAGRVLFIDARDGGEPGEIFREPVSAAAPGSFTHHMTPAAMLACAQALYGRAPEAMLLSVAGADFDPGPELSPAVRAVLPELWREVEAYLGRSE